MQLPGGLIENGTRRRDWAFRPLSGALELALAEAGESAVSTPRAVTRALALALDHLCGDAATPRRVAALCVADRQFLMRELERHLGHEGGWFQADCGHCGGRFDFRLDYAALPVQEAGAGYPQVRVDLDGRQWGFRLPTGADQEMLADLPDAEAGWLLRQLASEPDDLAEALKSFAGPPQERLGPLGGRLGFSSRGHATPALVAAAEAALEAIAPGIVLAVQTSCPECGGGNTVELDPYRALARGSESLLREVHQIATHYHWREADILDLPQTRRRRYLEMIDRARGMAE